MDDTFNDMVDAGLTAFVKGVHMEQRVQLTAKHADADKKCLSKAKWFDAFAHEHERRTAIPAVELEKDDVLTRYYSATTTPAEGVTEDIEKWDLDDVTQS